MYYDVSYRFATIIFGLCIRDNYIHFNRAPFKSVEMTPYELWFGRNLSCRFLEFGNATLMSDKLEPRAKKCVFIRYPKATIGYTFYHRSEGKVFFDKNGSFLEMDVLSKEVSGRKVELDKVVEPSL